MADTLTQALLEASLLASLPEEDEGSIVIDVDRRTMVLPTGFFFGVYNDKDILKVPFVIPRYYNELDLSEFQITVNYINSAGYGNIYRVTDAEVTDSAIRFKWVTGRGVFVKEGTVRFIVCLRQIGSNGEVEKEFNTTIASANVLKGLEVDENPDPIAYSILAHMEELKDQAEAAVDVVEGAADRIDNAVTEAEQAIAAMYHSPYIAPTAADMLSHDKVYVYTGNETGYTFGNWYYWNGSAFVSGGVYNATAFNTDDTLSISGAAADAKKTGDEIAKLNDASYVNDGNNIVGDYIQGYWANGSFTATEANNGRKIPIGNADKVNIVGYFSKWYDYYDFFDENDQIISYERNTTTAGNGDIIVNVPDNAEYVCVSSGSASDTANKKVYLIYSVAEEIGSIATDLSTLQTLRSMEIEGYEKSEWFDITESVQNVIGQYAEISNGRIVISTGNYQYSVIDVHPGEVFETTGLNYFDMRPAIYTNDDGLVLLFAPTARKTTAEHIAIETTAPAGATKLYIDEDKNNTIRIRKKGVYYVKEDENGSVGISVSINKSMTLDTTIVTECGAKIRQKLEVYNNTDQPNSAVLPRSVELFINDEWKEIVNNEDDNCPVNLGSGYIGAGHGYGRAFNIALTSHGKTFADIGSKWVTDATYPRTFYIVRIVDENNLVVLGADEPDSLYDTVNYWGNSTSLIHVEGAVHTDTLTGYTRSQYLLSPIDENHTKRILLDGIYEVSENGTYKAESFVDIVEEYDLTNPQSIVPTILDNTPSGGYTENPVVNTGVTFLHFSNVYRILADGTMLLFSTLDNDIPVVLGYWGGTQYAQKTSANVFGGAVYRYVPKLLPIDNHDLRTPFNLANWNFSINATAQYWEDENNPPDRLIHLYTDGSNQYTAGFAVGYLPIAHGSAKVRKSNIGNAMYLYSSKKAYFHLVDSTGVNGSSWDAFTPFQCVAYRKPIVDVADGHTDAYFIPYGETCYLYVDYHAVADDRIKIPAEYVGKKMRVIEASSNISVYGTTATDEIRIKCDSASPMYGYAVIELQATDVEDELDRVEEAISKVKEDLEPLEIIDSLDTNYSTHDVSSFGRSLVVVGNSFVTSVKIANGSSHIPSAEFYKNDTNSGIVVKPTGNGVNMDGTFTPASGRRLVTSNPLLPNDLAGKTVVLRVIADKPITFTNGAGLVPEFQFLINGSKKFGITLPVNEQVTLDLTKEFSYTASQAGKPYALVFANLQQGTNFDDVNVVFLMYDSETIIYDAETVLTDGETQAFNIPSECVDIIDTGVHQSKYYGVVNTKNYVDNNIPSGVITETDLPYVTPQMYGAKGDGVTDDTTSLQAFLNAAFDNAKIALIPSGTYLHTGLIFPAKTSQTDAFVPTIRGIDKSSVILKHTGSGVGVTVAPRTGTASINGVTISDMTLIGNANTTIGLELSDGYYMDIQNIAVNGASQSCVEMESVWLSNFRNIYCTPDSATGSGFLMTGGNCQHNTIDLIFVRNTKNIGMEIAGGTTMVGNLACDNASGEYAYVIKGFKGTIAGLGCENPTTETVVSFNMSQCFVADAGFLNYQPPEENYKGYAISVASSNVQIQNLKTFLGASAERQTCEGALFNIYYGHVTVNQMEGQQTFEKLINDAGFSNYDTLTLNDRSSSCISIRKRYERPYIGTDKRGIDKEVTGDALFDKSLFGNAIYLNCTGEARYKSDGTDCTANNPVYNGDWFIESDPATYNVAGYVIRNNCTTLTKNNSEERPIPLIIYGATADRPTHPFTGMMFFDTTLGKPIWYNGSAWVDAAGASIT